MQLFQSVLEHGTVLFFEHILPYLGSVVGGNAEEQPVEGCMVELAEGDAVTDARHTLGFDVGDDVGGIEELIMPEPAERALLTVSLDNPLPEAPLVFSGCSWTRLSSIPDLPCMLPGEDVRPAKPDIRFSCVFLHDSTGNVEPISRCRLEE